MKKYRTTLQILLPLLFIHLPVYASIISPHVFKIEAKNCSSCQNRDPMIQTGFLIKGKIEIKGKKPMSGIITTLHGVVGRESIRTIGTEFLKSNLEIIAEDIKRDIALLSSDELQKKQDKKQDGFNHLGQQTSYKEIRCIGYPLGKDGQEEIGLIRIRTNGTELLRHRLSRQNNAFRKLLKERKSPDIDEPVLCIEGQIPSGLSGAPILYDRDKVVGVADGTVQINSTISWAIPFDRIQLRDASDQQMVAEMKRIEPLSTSALSSLTLQISKSKTLMLQQMRSDEMMDWYAAQEYAKKMNRESLEGYSDWRLPAVGELQELAKVIKNSPGSYSDVDVLYWSSEDIGAVEAKVVNLGNAEMEWYDDGQVAIRDKDSKFSVRLVRSLIQ